MTGVRIDGGAQDWQVLQRGADGYATAELTGDWRLDNWHEADVYACACREDDGSVVAPWRRAEARGDRWHVGLRLPTGGAYRLLTCLTRKGETRFERAMHGQTRHFVSVGDVFALAGQSNMAGFGLGAAFDPPCEPVRMRRADGSWAMACQPLHDPTGAPGDAPIDDYNVGASPGLAFGRTIARRTGVPIGLLPCAKGGSTLADWARGGALRERLYGVAAQGVRGVVWYQGCSDAINRRGGAYGGAFAELVADARSRLGDVPFLTAQLGRHLDAKLVSDDADWALVREAQRRAARELPGVYVAPTLDLPLSDGIHLSAAGCVALGERLAALALQRVYGVGMQAEAPDLLAATRADEATVSLRFAPVCGQIFAKEQPARRLAFAVGDALGDNTVVAYREAGDCLLLALERPLAGEARVSYAASANPVGAPPIDSQTALPILAFGPTPINKED